MRQVRYVSGYGTTFFLNQNAVIKLKSIGVNDVEWKYKSKDNQYGVKLKRFEKDPLAIDVTFNFKSALASQILDAFFEACEKDIINMKIGRLYIDNTYIEGYFTKRNTDVSKDFWGYSMKATFVAPYPFWIEEKVFMLQGSQSRLGEFNYPYNYPSNYYGEVVGQTTINTQHFAPSNFKMTIQGPAVNPQININNHVHRVNTTLTSTDRLEIVSLDSTIVKFSGSGTKTNCFGDRYTEQSIFEKIPTGIVPVSWSGGFTAELVVYNERSEPRWS